MRSAWLFATRIFPRFFPRHNYWPRPIINTLKQQASSLANNHLNYTGSNHFLEFTLENFKEKMKREEEIYLDSNAFSDSMNALLPIENDADLKNSFETAYAKLECVKRDYRPNQSDSIFKLNLGRVLDALDIFTDIFEYSSVSAKTVKKAAFEYLSEFQKYFKAKITFEDQKREYYLKIDHILKKFLEKEKAKLLEPAAMDCAR